MNLIVLLSITTIWLKKIYSLPKKANLSVKSLDAVCNDTEYSKIDKLFSLTHEIGAVGSKGKRWFVTLEMKMPNCESQLVKCQLDTGSTCNTISYADFFKICFDESKLKSSNVKLKLYDGTTHEDRVKFNVDTKINCSIYYFK